MRPEQTVHRGRVAAVGVALPARWTQARRRAAALALWEPGARVLQGPTLFVVFARPRRLRREELPGEPLVESHGLLSTAPLSPGELRRLRAPSGSWVWVERGEATVLAPGALAPVDPAGWIDLSGQPLQEVVPLGPEPAPPPLPVAPEADLRKVLPGVPAADVRAVQFVRGMAEPGLGRRPSWWRTLKDFLGLGGDGARAAPAGGAGGVGPGGEGSAGARPGGAGAGRGGRGWRGRGSAGRALGGEAPAPWWLRWLLSRRAGGGGRGGAGGLGSGSGLAQARLPGPAPGPGWLEWLRARWSEAVLRSELGRWLGERQARYLASLIRALESGDTEDALRRAVPLGRGRGGAARWSFGLPGARQSLSPRLGAPGGGGSVMPFGGDVYERLRSLYRAALGRLERQGQHERAAFVLADLLDAPTEAVAYLERHGLLELAAKLAEARQLDPGLVVRQWFLAGDGQRAIEVARRHGAFADALARLHDHPHKQLALRSIWCKLLASEGDYAAAVRAAWPVAETRRQAAQWLDPGIAAGGPGGAELLVWKALWLPTRWRESAAAIEELLADDSPEGAPARLAFARAVQQPSDPEQPVGAGDRRAAMASVALRALLRDEAAQRGDPNGPLVKRLAGLADDAALVADRPRAKRPCSSLQGQAHLRHLRLPLGDRGLTPSHDVALLPDGRLLVAQGEAGVLLLSRRGREHRFDVPATHLVVNDTGTRALAVAQRDERVEHVELAKLDLVRRRARAWKPLAAQRWTDSFGGLWFAVVGRQVLALDPLEEHPRASWNIDLGEGWAMALSRDAEQLSIASQSLEDLAPVVRVHELPSLTQRRRFQEELEAQLPQPWLAFEATATPDGRLLATRLGEHEGGLRLELQVATANSRHSHFVVLDGEPGPPRPGRLGTPLSAAGFRLPRVALSHGVELLAVPRDGVPRLRVTFEGASRLHLRPRGQLVAWADDVGRVGLLDLGVGALLRQHRL